MTIDDELIYELIKPDRYGKVGEKALIIKIVGTRKIIYKLEESESDYQFYFSALEVKKEDFKITPDITVTIPQ